MKQLNNEPLLQTNQAQAEGTPNAALGMQSLNPSSTVNSTMDIAALETVYDQLAQAIDQAGQTNAQVFLVKLALLNAKALVDLTGSNTVVIGNIDDALEDLQCALSEINTKG